MHIFFKSIYIYIYFLFNSKIMMFISVYSIAKAVRMVIFVPKQILHKYYIYMKYTYIYIK